MQHTLKIILFTGLLSIGASTTYASEKAWAALQRGDAVALMRNELVNLYQFSTPWEASVKE